MSEIKDLLLEQGKAFEEFVKRNNQRLGQLEKDTLEMLKRANRPPAGRSSDYDSDHTDDRLGRAIRAAFTGDDAELKGMSVGDDSTGGYLVVPQLDSAIRSIRTQLSPLSGLAREIVIAEGAEVLLPYVRGTLTSTWIGETANRPETDSLLVGTHRIELHEHYAMPSVTQKLLDTAHYDVGALIVDQIAHGLAVGEGTALYSGDGVGQPRGIAAYDMASTGDSTREWGTIQYVPTGASGAWHTTKADPLFDTVAALAPQYRANAVWLMNRSTAASIRKLKEATTDQYLWVTGLTAGQPDMLLGYPVMICDDLPDLGAGSLSIWFGDFRQAYTIVRMPGVKLLRDPYSSKGKVNYYAYSRVGGAVVNSDALKAIKFATS